VKDGADAPLGPRPRAIARHAEKLTGAPASVGPADLDALRAAGLDDRAIVDLTLCVAYFNFVNRVAHGLGVRLEGEEEA
jgi:uncharacterized peroxidase-related enzyme